MTIELKEAGVKDIPLLRELAEESWKTAYQKILSPAQISFMLNKMYAPELLHNQISSGNYPYFLAYVNKCPAGFLALETHQADAAVKLQKLYLLQENRGKGVGEKMLQFAENQVINWGMNKIYLNVNKQNPALDFYLRNGFTKTGEGVFDIGEGFVMDDFILTKVIQKV